MSRGNFDASGTEIHIDKLGVEDDGQFASIEGVDYKFAVEILGGGGGGGENLKIF